MKTIVKCLMGAGAIAALASAAPAAAQFFPGYGYPGYGYPGYGAGGIIGSIVNSVEIRGNGGYTVRGTATGGMFGPTPVGFTCHTDPRGLVMRVAFNNRYYGNGYSQPYTGAYYGPNNNPYAAYGYSRY